MTTAPEGFDLEFEGLVFSLLGAGICSALPLLFDHYSSYCNDEEPNKSNLKKNSHWFTVWKYSHSWQ